ncbi:MAG: MATE family efflux transporter [Clostridia bacterium]|nr:MATE family efflux transporter [Clostridia bacterium]
MRIQLSDHFNYKKLLMFVAPSIIMMVFTNIYTVVDGLFISNFAGSEAVAAINRIFPLILILGSVGFMVGAGGSALVSKTLGEGNKERANAYFSLLVYVTFGIGILIAVGGQFIVPPVAVFLGAKGVTYDYCVLYGRWLLAGQPFFILQNIFQSFFVTAEKPRLGLIVTVAAGVTNMVFDAILVAGFKLGLTGAAAATVASQVLGGVFPVIYFACKNNSLLRLTGTKFYGRALVKSFTNGSSEFLSNVSSSVVMMLYNMQVDKFAGDAGVAAYGIVMYVVMVFFAVFMGYAVGSAPLIGYNYGAQNKDELKNLFRKSLIIVTVFGVSMTVLSEALSYPLCRMFISYDEGLFQMTLRGFRIYSIVFLIAGYGVFASSLFTALNNGLISGIISFLRTLVYQVTCIMVFPLIWELDGVWSSIIFADICALITSAVFIVAMRRKYGYC